MLIKIRYYINLSDFKLLNKINVNINQKNIFSSNDDDELNTKKTKKQKKTKEKEIKIDQLVSLL